MDFCAIVPGSRTERRAVTTLGAVDSADMQMGTELDRDGDVEVDRGLEKTTMVL